MTDKISIEKRSANMRAIRSKDMKPELLVRKLLHSSGFRYRLHVKDLPGKPDIVFRKRRKCVFVHGCYWHQHPGCREGRLPKSNQKYWLPKLQRNIQRDQQALDQLGEAGWDVLVVWECEMRNAVELNERLMTFLND